MYPLFIKYVCEHFFCVYTICPHCTLLLLNMKRNLLLLLLLLYYYFNMLIFHNKVTTHILLGIFISAIESITTLQYPINSSICLIVVGMVSNIQMGINPDWNMQFNPRHEDSIKMIQYSLLIHCSKAKNFGQVCHTLNSGNN